MPSYPAGRRHPSLEPIHPGAILREDVLPALGISVTAAAKALGISRQALHAVLAERASITPDMAVRIGKFCGDGPRIWLAMQQERDLWDAERRLAAVTKSIPTMRAA